MSLQAKKFEIFSGTGGVGKTTLAASRAIELAKAGKRTLLITIDPAKRLKELFSLNDEQAGEVVTSHDPLDENESYSIDVELMNPQSTFKRIADASDASDILENRIIKILTKPYGGLNEILAIVELSLQEKSGKYDAIVLDTPPGSHFLDFLDSAERIRLFFDQSFIDIFQYLGKKVDTSKLNLGKRMMNLVVGPGIKKLLGYLNKVTGDQFVEDFIEAIIHIYRTKDSFLNALDLQKELRDGKLANWYLVTSVEQNKLKEALDLQSKATGLITEDSYIALNKCMEKNLKEWEPSAASPQKDLKNSLLDRETKLKNNLKDKFKNIIEFPEIFSLSPIEHLKSLTTHWTQIEGSHNG